MFFVKFWRCHRCLNNPYTVKLSLTRKKSTTTCTSRDTLKAGSSFEEINEPSSILKSLPAAILYAEVQVKSYNHFQKGNYMNSRYPGALLYKTDAGVRPSIFKVWAFGEQKSQKEGYSGEKWDFTQKRGLQWRKSKQNACNLFYFILFCCCCCCLYKFEWKLLNFLKSLNKCVIS